MPAIPLSMHKAAEVPGAAPRPYPPEASVRPASGLAIPLGLLCRAVSSVGGGFIVGSYFGTLAGIAGAVLGAGLLLVNERQSSRPSA